MKKIISKVLVIVMMLCIFGMYPCQNVKAATIASIEPKLGNDNNDTMPTIPQDTDIKIKFDEKMDPNTFSFKDRSIVLYESTFDSNYSWNQALAFDSDKSYDEQTNTLTIKTSKYIYKGLRYKLDIDTSKIKTASGQQLGRSDINYYFKTEEDTTNKVNGLCICQDDSYMKIDDGGKAAGSFDENSIYLSFGKEIDRSTINTDSIRLLDGSGQLEPAYVPALMTNGKRIQLKIKHQVDEISNPYSIIITQGLKGTDGNEIDVDGSPVGEKITVDGKKALKLKVNFDSRLPKIESVNITTISGEKVSLSNAQDNATCVENVSTDGEINVIFNEDMLQKFDEILMSKETGGYYPPTVSTWKTKYIPEEKRLNIKYENLDESQLYSIELKLLRDSAGNHMDTKKLYFKTIERPAPPVIKSVEIPESSMPSEKFKTEDLTTDLNKIKMKADKSRSDDVFKIVFNKELKSSLTDVPTILDNTKEIRVLDKDLKYVEGLSAYLKEDKQTVALKVKDVNIFQENSPYYMAITEGLKSKFDLAFEPIEILGGQLKNLSDGKKALLIPLNFDTEGAKYKVLDESEEELTQSEATPSAISKTEEITVNFNESMKTEGSYGIGLMSRGRSNVQLERQITKPDGTKDYELLKEFNDENYVVNENSVTLKMDWNKLGIGKTYRVLVNDAAIEDLVGWKCRREGEATTHKFYIIPTNKVNKNSITVTAIDAPVALKLGKDLNLKIKAVNKSKDIQQITLIAALYNDAGKFIRYTAASQNIKPQDEIEITAFMNMPKQGSYKVKYFVWDNIKNMNPISKCVEIPVE